MLIWSQLCSFDHYCARLITIMLIWSQLLITIMLLLSQLCSFYHNYAHYIPVMLIGLKLCSQICAHFSGEHNGEIGLQIGPTVTEIFKIPLSRGILLYLYCLFLHGYYSSSYYYFSPQFFFSFLFCGQLLQNCQADLPEIFSHDTYTIGQGPAIFQILIRIMDHDPDHFKGFQKNLRISETTQRIFNIFISNESSHWSLQSLLQKLKA